MWTYAQKSFSANFSLKEATLKLYLIVSKQHRRNCKVPKIRESTINFSLKVPDKAISCSFRILIMKASYWILKSRTMSTSPGCCYWCWIGCGFLEIFDIYMYFTIIPPLNFFCFSFSVDLKNYSFQSENKLHGYW